MSWVTIFLLCLGLCFLVAAARRSPVLRSSSMHQDDRDRLIGYHPLLRIETVDRNRTDAVAPATSVASGRNACEHHFSVDVEEYYHPHAMTPYVSECQWEQLDRRTPFLLHRLLDGMDRRGVVGTFFVLGWLARREPGMIREIVRRGHEVASHGWGHRRVTSQTPLEFRESVRQTKNLLEDITGTQVLGFRAPSFSIVPSYEWAFEVLVEEGYRYDSSLFPIRIHPTYGYPTRSRDPHWIETKSGTLLEFPMSTYRLLGRDLPASGGAYLRFFPLGLIRGALEQARQRGAPGILYVHPWEIDLETPTLGAKGLARLRMTGGVGRLWGRLDDLWSSHTFRHLGATLREMSH